MTLIKSVSIVAPCLNEEGNVRELVARLIRAANAREVDAEVVLIDDGSTDRTWEVIRQLEVENMGAVTSVRHLSNRGIPHGWISGVSASRGQLVCLIDADLQNPPEEVFRLLDCFRSGDYDLVRGIRVPVAKSSFSRVLMSRTLNSLLNLVFGMKSRDNKSGFVLGPRQVLLDLVHHRGHYEHFQTFIGVAAHSRGLRVEEIDTPFEDRRSGFSFLAGRSWSVIFAVLRDVPEAAREYGWRFSKGKE